MLNIYRASAGSGKTYRLTRDYIHLLFDSEHERNHRHILAVTFTNKATDEMKNRILKELHALATGEISNYREELMSGFHLNEEAVNERARKILVSILHDYSAFSISTIDRFFQQVIRAFAREIGVNGGYNLELDNDTTLQQSVDNLFLDLGKEENRQLLSWLTQFAEDRIEQSENWNPRRSIEDLGKEIFKESYQYKAEDTNRKLHDRDFLKNYREKLHKIESDFEESVKKAAQKALNVMSAHGLSHDDFAYKATGVLDKLLKGEYKTGTRFTGMAENVENCYSKSKPQHIKNAIENAYNGGLQEAFQDIIHLLNEDIVFYNTANIIGKHINTLGILSDLAMQIRQLTDEQNTMLISDANMLLNRIIDNSDTPFVYEKTGIHIDHFMIDEFQDTSSLQWKNFFPLIQNSLSSGKFNLVVGDVKQSIYRWRNSDWKLLDEQIQNDFRPEQLHEENLGINWRSDQNIISFNNEFFRCAALLLQQKLNDGIEPVQGIYPDLKDLTHRIVHAYAQLHQDASPRAEEGRVEISFINQAECEDWREESLNRLPAILEDLQERGYRPGDVAILVRTNNEEQAVIHKLLSYKSNPEAKSGMSYDIMGNEGLLISSSASVRFILGIMRLLINPADSIQQTIVGYEYARARMKREQSDALHISFLNRIGEDGFPAIFAEEEHEKLASLRNNSLYDMVEHIIALFDVGTWHNEAIFVQAFQDVVFRFTSGKNTDLYSFLKWWDKNGEKQCIATPENPDAFRTMTIHKSKGLDFKVVVMPFADWAMDKKSGYLRNILWCSPKEAPFNELPLLPVEYSSKLGNSVFAEYYFDEQMHQFIDNLNVAYVAFTRSKHELICLAPKPEKEPENIEKISSLSDLLYFSFTQTIEMNDGLQLTDNFDKDKTVYNLGPKTTEKNPEPKNTEEQEIFNFYPSTDSSSRLRIRRQSTGYWLEDQGLTDSRLNYGIIMHDILCKIIRKEDQEKAIAETIREGRISESDREFINQEFQKFWKLPHVTDWFAADLKSMNEVTILTPTGEIYRPDRVVFRDKSAIVVDYKFGNSKEKMYSQQVKTYMQQILNMGYHVKGYLCYVSLAEVVEVS
ncbi:MAG: UvrD-helicase domain-containing protein [Paludibacter sp.]|nr:UvrD-helicase domain-containing protein [Paludibacter sp.]